MELSVPLRVNARTDKATERRQIGRIDGDLPVARSALQCMHGSRAARSGIGASQDLRCGGG